MAYAVEVTDTFGKEANYSWVRRYRIPALRSDPVPGAKQAAVVRAAKRAAGWSGMRCEVSRFGDEWHVRPVGRSAPCWIMFVSWTDDDVEPEAE